jgi:hypothetical protein
MTSWELCCAVAGQKMPRSRLCLFTVAVAFVQVDAGGHS